MRRFLLTILALTFFSAGYSAEINFTTATFTVEALEAIPSGSTVLFEPGVYKMNEALRNAWQGTKRHRITYKRKGDKGEVIFDAGEMEGLLGLQFRYMEELVFRDLVFENIKFGLYGCKKSTIDRVTVRENKVTADGIVALLRCDHCVISNCEIILSDKAENGRGIAVWNGDYNKILNNTIRGRLRGAVKTWTSQNGDDRSMNLLIQGGHYTRETTEGSEDHGIYTHDCTTVVIDGVTISGFSDSSAGGSIKLKNDDNIEVKNCVFSTSGILLRIESQTWFHLENLWIHDNLFIDGSVGSWTPDLAPEGIVIENNRFLKGSVGIARNATAENFNKYSALAKKNGGIYRNEIAKAISAPEGTNVCGNFMRTTAVDDDAPLTNIALGKPARQSNDLTEQSVAGLAVDGNTEAGQEANLARTHPGEKRYWQVNLGGVAEIHSIKIWAGTEDLNNFDVLVSRDFMGPKGNGKDYGKEACVVKRFKAGTVGEMYELEFESPVFGKYVRIARRGEDDALDLAEVEVMGKMLTEEDPSSDPAHVPEQAPEPEEPETLAITDPNEISISPNPVADRLHVVAKSEIKRVELINLSGKVINVFEAPGREVELYLKGLGKGLYFVLVSTHDGNVIRNRLVKR
ncbi:hypothetical protein FUAX_09260 [Fulvitalea axinellae]|uniref:Secretion system C-terminal sorting domain-containing protein n=1 Tax=Fulvitalea axinellae TaxID=1182444 RepID=A0AAU9D252_9BACT|nr:hypothetical protein FUAX_09260 [Fulvitalea axinellae]